MIAVNALKTHIAMMTSAPCTQLRAKGVELLRTYVLKTRTASERASVLIQSVQPILTKEMHVQAQTINAKEISTALVVSQLARVLRSLSSVTRVAHLTTDALKRAIVLDHTLITSVLRSLRSVTPAVYLMTGVLKRATVVALFLIIHVDLTRK
jgi:hypothetical protein